MKKLLFLLLLVLTVNIHAQDQKQVATATIRFYRPHRFEGSALKPPLFVDDADVAHLHNGDAVEIIVLAGSHRVNSNDKSTGIDLDAKAGQTYYIRVDIKTGAWKGHGAITLVDPQQGKFEFSKQKISVTKNFGFGTTGTPMEAVSQQPPAPTTAPTLTTPPTVKEGGEATREGIATVAVSTNPDGADVYADGVFVGNAPANLKLPAGKHTIRVSQSEYKDWSREITVQAGAESRLIATLEKK
jgi:PEGA domain-containing protein/uncharacterized protein DUF2846